MTALIRPRPIALGLLALCTWLVWMGQAPANVPQRRASAAPSRCGLWEGTPLAVEQRALEILETDDVTTMEYRLGEEPPVWLAQVAGFGNRAAFHPPELCYVGSHFEVMERGEHTVVVNGAQRRVMRLVISQGNQRFEAWYWFTANGRVTPNYYQQQAWLLLDTARRQPVSGTLVRISTPADDSERTGRRLLAFLTAWEASKPAEVSHGS